MIGLMPYTGSVESYPTATTIGWASYIYNAGNWSGNILHMTVGKLYVMVTAGSNSTTYINTPTGWTLGYRASNITFHYKIADFESESLAGSRTGTGSISTPIIFEISNFKSATPTLTNTTFFSSSTAASCSITTTQKNTLILEALWLSASKTVAASAFAGSPNPVFAASDLIITDEIKTYTTTKTAVGLYTFYGSWTGSISSRTALYAIR